MEWKKLKQDIKELEEEYKCQNKCGSFNLTEVLETNFTCPKCASIFKEV